MHLLRSHQGLTVLPGIILALSLLGCSGSGVKGRDSNAKPQTATSPVGPAQAVSPAQGRLLGDMDDDGAATVGDAIRILRIVVGLDPDDPCADANENGSTDVGDAIKVLRCVVGLDTWPIGECNGGPQYQRVKYVIEDPWQDPMVVRSCAAANGVANASFDIGFLTPGTGPHPPEGYWVIWVVCSSGMVAADGNNDPPVRSGPGRVEAAFDYPCVGWGCYCDTPGGNYFLDVDGGSDMGGWSHQFHMSGTYVPPAAAGLAGLGLPGATATVLLSEGRGQVRPFYEGVVNPNGAMSWDSLYRPDETYAHQYPADSDTGQRLKEYTTIRFDAASPTGLIYNDHGYTVTRVVEAYPTAQATTVRSANGDEPYVIDFSIKFPVGEDPETQELIELLFVPALVEG